MQPDEHLTHGLITSVSMLVAFAATGQAHYEEPRFNGRLRVALYMTAIGGLASRLWIGVLAGVGIWVYEQILLHRRSVAGMVLRPRRRHLNRRRSE